MQALQEPRTLELFRNKNVSCCQNEEAQLRSIDTKENIKICLDGTHQCFARTICAVGIAQNAAMLKQMCH